MSTHPKVSNSYGSYAAVHSNYSRGLAIYQGRYADERCFTFSGGLLAHPGMTVECIYVPLLMAASKAADDLSVASVTRGIENPNLRTCLVQIKCGVADWGVMAVAVAYLIFELCVRGGVIG